MNEIEARAWLSARNVPRETYRRLEQLVELVQREAAQQNLVAHSTLAEIWQRHVVDSAQLIDLAPARAGRWIDIGTGAGFPGIVVGLLWPGSVQCIEPRTLRADFLRNLVAELDLGDRTTIIAMRAESAHPAGPCDVISARAVAPLGDLFRSAHHLTTRATTWLLPKGRRAAEELAEARRTWQGDFRLVPSITDPAASIVVARDVRPRTGR